MFSAIFVDGNNGQSFILFILLLFLVGGGGAYKIITTFRASSRNNRIRRYRRGSRNRNIASYVVGECAAAVNYNGVPLGRSARQSKIFNKIDIFTLKPLRAWMNRAGYSYNYATKLSTIYKRGNQRSFFSSSLRCNIVFIFSISELRKKLFKIEK